MPFRIEKRSMLIEIVELGKEKQESLSGNSDAHSIECWGTFSLTFQV
jgi:hypothetical protein